MKTKHILTFAISFLFCRCDHPGTPLTFKNETEKKLYTVASVYYPDTIGKIAEPHFWHKVLPYEKNTDVFSSRNGDYESVFVNVDSDTLIIFVIDYQIVETTSNEDIWKDYLILQRYDLSKQDLEDLNWCISYPPSEQMKDIKMYPSYKKNSINKFCFKTGYLPISLPNPTPN